MKKVGKIFGKIFECLLNIGITITIIIVVILLYGTFQTEVQKKDYSNIFGYTVFQVSTGSMSGTIEVEDIIIVKILNNEDNLEVNDIVVFKQDQNIITHRLVEIGENELITKGDANNAKDKPIQREDVIGKVIKIIPNVATWKKVLMSKEVYIPIIITVTLIIIISIISDNKEELDKDDK